MIIQHSLKLDTKDTAPLIVRSEYNIVDHSLTRIIESKIETINLKPRGNIPCQDYLEKLERLSKLDNTTFKDLAYLQRKKGL